MIMREEDELGRRMHSKFMVVFVLWVLETPTRAHSSTIQSEGSTWCEKNFYVTYL